MTHAEYFSEIYKNKIWGDGSGGGSTPEATVKYRALIQWFIKRYEIKSVVDFGCGYFHGFNHLINWKGIYYSGIDCVEEVINKNYEIINDPMIKFGGVEHWQMLLDKEDYKGDLLIIKDVCQHWDNKDIIEFSKCFKKFKFILITNDCYQRKDWQDLKAGHRALSARFEPLKQFKPEIMLKANHKETCLIRGDS